MTDRSEWFTVLDKNDAVVGEVAPEVVVLLFAQELVEGFLGGGNRVRLLSRPPEHAGVTVTVPSARTVTASGFSVIEKKFTGASAEAELAGLNPDNEVRLDRVLVGAGKPPSPQSDTSNTFTSLDEWLMTVHEVKQAGHRLACCTEPKARVVVVLDYDTDKTYSLPFRYLYATSHGVQPSTVKAWGYEGDPLELLRQVRDHNLREALVAGTPDHFHDGVFDAQPDAELEGLFMDGAEQVLAALNAHTASMKKQPGYLKSQQHGSR